MSVRARRTRRSHEIIIPWSGGGGHYVNPTNADEVFAEHGYIGLQNHDDRSPVYFRNIYVKDLGY
jgi:hypothetical protein